MLNLQKIYVVRLFYLFYLKCVTNKILNILKNSTHRKFHVRQAFELIMLNNFIQIL